MMVLKVENIGKAYRKYRSELCRFARWFGFKIKPRNENWVLRNVSFAIQPGEAIGLVGQNGAGKSTLLKIITGTTQSTEGKIHVNGRIAAILELGMGFNPELSGRQNVYYAAGLMGFSRDQINAAIDDIEAFAEIGDYFNKPVRTYSSGMQVRVAFAVATAWRPDILIVDEALSVGDAYFQHKSFDRIRQFQHEGTTLILVSHDKSAIQALCDRAILLEAGKVIKDGLPEAVFDYYNAIIAEKNNSTVETKELADGSVKTSSGTGEAKIESITLINDQGIPAEHIYVGENVELQIKVRVHQNVERLVLGIGIKDRLGQVMFGTNTWHTEQVVYNPKAGQTYLYRIPFTATLGVGSYSLQTALTDRDTHLIVNYQWLDYALIFEVVNSNKYFFLGSQWLNLSFKIKEF